MIKKALLFVTALLSAFLLPAQGWIVRYPSGHPTGYSHFHDGYIDKAGVIFLAGQEGPNRETSDAILFRIRPDGSHSAYRYVKDGFRSVADCIVELPDEHLFVTGKLSNDTCDRLIALVFDKELNLLEERQYDQEVDSVSFGRCKGILDSQGNVIVATYVVQDNGYKGVFHRGVFYKFNQQGDTICHRYLLADEPDPVAYLVDFRVRQLWYKEQNETLLCLVPGFGGVMSFITFDANFNYIEEHPIWREQSEKSDHTLYRDCYTDHWFTEDEALFFSSIGAADHNRLRVSRVTTQGEILELSPLNERTDTIDDAAQPRCMATSNDNTFYFSFHYHRWGYYPGTACVYRLNDRLEITGCHIDDDHESYRTCLILPTADGGCVTVNDSCNYYPFAITALPVIRKIDPDDFCCIPWTVTQADAIASSPHAYPNPCDATLHIPITEVGLAERIRCRVEDTHGSILMDCFVPLCGDQMTLDVSQLKTGLYHYRIYSGRKTLFSETFIKK